MESQRKARITPLYGHEVTSPPYFTVHFQCAILTSETSNCVHRKASVRWLLDHGAHPHAGAPADCMLISHAAQDGSIETIKLLIERGANPKDGIPLNYAIVREKEDWKAVIELFLDHGCDINEVRLAGISRRGRPQCDPGTVLHTAARWNCH